MLEKLNIIISPLEQFKVYNVFDLFEVTLVEITNLFFSFIISIFFIFFLIYNKNYLIYKESNKYKLLDNLYLFVKGIFKENVLVNKPFFFPLIFFIFLLFLTSNITGLIPFSFTLTSSIMFTFFFSISSFINVVLLSFRVNKLKFFNTFLPTGTPLEIVPFIILIEFISFNARVFSLAIRLFANIMSGHILLKILATAAWGALILWFPISTGLFIIPFIVIFIISILEFAIAFLQAYVFITLLSIYYNESINLH